VSLVQVCLGFRCGALWRASVIPSNTTAGSARASMAACNRRDRTSAFQRINALLAEQALYVTSLDRQMLTQPPCCSNRNPSLLPRRHSHP
jgi:hypothetical protein